MDSTDSPLATTAGSMTLAGSREYLLSILTQAKLNRKGLPALEEAVSTWRRRVELAAKAGDSALEMAARTEHQAAQDKLAKILAETESLEAEARALHKKLPVIAASERSIDPDLLEEELLIVSGREPGSGDDLATERKFAELEKKSSADDALERLKASMGMAAGGGPVGSPDPQSGTGDSSKRS